MYKILFLVEGQDDFQFYKMLLGKIYEIEIKDATYISELFGGEIGRRSTCILLGDKEIYLTWCGGIDKLKNMLRYVLAKADLARRVKEDSLKVIVVAVDLNDKSEDQIINEFIGIISSIGIGYSKVDNCIRISIDASNIDIYVITQGLIDEAFEKHSLEEYIIKILGQRYPRISNEVLKLIENLNLKPSPKMVIGLYEAVLVENKGIPPLISKVIWESDISELKEKIADIVNKLMNILRLEDYSR